MNIVLDRSLSQNVKKFQITTATHSPDINVLNGTKIEGSGGGEFELEQVVDQEYTKKGSVKHTQFTAIIPEKLKKEKEKKLHRVLSILIFVTQLIVVKGLC